MNRDDTFIKMYRKCLNNPIFRQKPFDKWHAWEYLLLQARNEPTDIMAGDEIIHLERGELYRSYHSLAEEFGWKDKQVRNFIAKLKSSGMLATVRHSKGQTLTIENYSFYQCDGQSKGQSKGNQKALKGQQRKNDKECKRNIYGDFFEQIWKTYPKKKGKAQVKDKQKERLYLIGKEQIEKCIERYKQQIEKDHTAEQYIMYGSTFFNGGYVDYLDENYNEPKHKTLADTMKVF